MKFLILEWSAYMQADMEDALHRIGIITVEYGYRILNWDDDPYFYRRFDTIISLEKPDAVMMMNYMAPMAELCAKYGIPYISWVYDCPFGLRNPEKTLGLKTNHVYFFDKNEVSEFVRKGYNNVKHLPLAVNTERIDKLLSGEEDKYRADVSFVGILYDNQYETMRGFVKGSIGEEIDKLVGEQLNLYGEYIIIDRLKELLYDKGKMEEVRDMFQDNISINGLSDDVFFDWMVHTIGKEVTRRERIMILILLSKRSDTVLYTPSINEKLSHVRYGGVVSAYNQAPFVYRESRINLNITLKDITSGMSLRVLEILGAGGFLLTNKQLEIGENFKNGEEVIMYESIADAVEKTEYYISHDSERKRIAEAGRRAVERFSFDNQVKKMIKDVFGEVN